MLVHLYSPAFARHHRKARKSIYDCPSPIEIQKGGQGANGHGKKETEVEHQLNRRRYVST
jgi:hypothetical protein